MKKNKLIIFDWGNIVESHTTNYTMFDAYNDLFKELGYKGNDIFEVLSKYHMTTIKTESDFKNKIEKIFEDLNLDVSIDKFIERYNYYCDKIYYYKDVRDYEVSLKDRCYIAIFSNLYVIDKKRLDKQVGLSNYDYLFLSFDMELKKPNIESYEYVTSKVPFDKKDILFIDDRKSNVDVAKEYGWNAYELTGLQLDEIKKVCEEFLKD